MPGLTEAYEEALEFLEAKDSAGANVRVNPDSKTQNHRPIQR